MGDQITTAGDHASLIPPSEAARLLATDGGAHDRTAAFATMCRMNALGMIHLAGSGHIGSTFSSLDIVSFLLLEHLGDDDVYFSSKGHDVPGYYAAMLALGNLDWSLVTKLRRLGGLPGHPDIHTPTVMFNTGSLGMGISKAKGLIAADRLAGRDRDVVVMTGDGELQEGQIWESLATAARDKMRELTVVVDHNRLQSDMAVAKVSDIGSIEAKFTAFGWDTARIDGHDLGQLKSAFARDTEGPKAIVAETVKGAGVSFTEHTVQPADQEFYPYHSGALPEAQYVQARDELFARLRDQFTLLGLEPPQVEEVERHGANTAPTTPTRPTTTHRQIDAYGRALVELGTQRYDVVVLDADLMLDCGLTDFRNTFGGRFIECGIAEQDMVSQAGGLAAGGMLPFVNSFGAFLSQRPSEQIANNASEHRKIVYMGSLAGLIPAGPGHSHQATRDIASFGSVPGVQVIAPATEQQVTDAVAYAASDTTHSVYLRLCPLAVELPFDDHPLPAPGQGTILHAGNGALTVVAYGATLLTEAFMAIANDEDLLEQVTLINLPWVSDPDATWVAEHAPNTLIVLDDHEMQGGLGERLAARLSTLDEQPSVHIIGLDGIPECGQADEVLAHHGLDRSSLQQKFLETLRR